jgi:hypothetical protein
MAMSGQVMSVQDVWGNGEAIGYLEEKVAKARSSKKGHFRTFVLRKPFGWTPDGGRDTARNEERKVCSVASLGAWRASISIEGTVPSP